MKNERRAIKVEVSLDLLAERLGLPSSWHIAGAECTFTDSWAHRRLWLVISSEELGVVPERGEIPVVRLEELPL